MKDHAEIVRELFAAINRNDLQAVRELFDTKIERIEASGFATAGTYRGRTDVLAHLNSGRSTWEEGTCEPERILVSGDKAVALLHVHVRLKGATEWKEGRFADGFVFHDGKIMQMRTFAERQEALKWAGIEDTHAN